MNAEQENNPFAFWQQFWQNATPQVAPFLPPSSSEEINKKINELKNIEVWLNFNLQAVRAQMTILEQQKQFLDSAQKVMETVLKNPKEEKKY